MAVSGDGKFKGKMTHGLKNNIRNLVNFYASSQKSESFYFDGLLLSQACNVLDEKLQKSFVSWHWRVMQSLKKNWLLVPKMTWGIGWILMWVLASLKICALMCYFCRKYITLDPYLWRTMQSLKRNWLCVEKCQKNYRGGMCHDTQRWCNI